MNILGWLKGTVELVWMLLRLPPRHVFFVVKLLRDGQRTWHKGQRFLNTFFPPSPSKAFRRFANLVVERRRVPFNAYMAATSECPCDCAHCSYKHRESPDMTSEQMLRAVRQVRELGTCTICFTGGEPLLRPDLADLIASVADDTITGIATTGHGLTLERAQELARAGLTWTLIGFESSDPKQHDEIRRVEGSFEQGRLAVKASLEAGIFTTIGTVAFLEKMDSGELERIYQMGKAWGVNEFRVIPPVATGGITGCTGSMLTPEQLRRVHDFHIEHNRRRDGGPSMACFPYIESPDVYGCGGGYHHVFIDAAGEVCPCDVTPLSFGNLNERPLAEIWEEMAEHFPRPRCRCLMREIGKQIPSDGPLPLPPQKSASLVKPPPKSMPLPRGYRGLLPDPSKNADDEPPPSRGAKPTAKMPPIESDTDVAAETVSTP